MLHWIILVVTLLALLPDLYIWGTFVRDGRLLWRVLFWLPTAVLALTALSSLAGRWQMGLFRMFIVLFLLAVLPKLLFVVCSLAGRLLALAVPALFGVCNGLGLLLGTVVLLGSFYGLAFGWRHVVVRHVDIVSKQIPVAFDGYTIVQLSDFHIGTYMQSPRTVDEIVSKVNALQPDVVCFTGDLVNLAPEEVTPFMTALSAMKAKDGVFSILGNHDYCEYRHATTPDESPARSLTRLVEAERQMGWNVLRNEWRSLYRGGDSIAIIGVENDGRSPFPARADLRRATRGLDSSVYKILLSHDPSHWRRSVLPETDIQLTLSGHTHAMQLKVCGFSPSQWIYPEWGGLYEEGTRRLHVSTGVGSNVAFRLGAWPEINVITLRHGR